MAPYERADRWNMEASGICYSGWRNGSISDKLENVVWRILFFMYIFRWLDDFQTERIRAFLSASGEGFYLTSVLSGNSSACFILPAICFSGKE